ncbi:MAG: DUF5985 family protein [Chthoniobacterales bacterium]
MNVVLINPFLSGALCMASLTIALFFLKFWRRTGDRFFLAFSGAFLLLMLERIILFAIGVAHEFAPYVYVVRLLAFILIIAAIVEKNRRP